MIEGILGKKLGMTQVFAADGRWIPVTVVEAGPCTVLQKKTKATDGYDAVQLGFGEKKSHRVSKPLMGHFRKTGQGAFAHLRELRAESVDAFQRFSIAARNALTAPADVIATGASATSSTVCCVPAAPVLTVFVAPPTFTTNSAFGGRSNARMSLVSAVSPRDVPSCGFLSPVTVTATATRFLAASTTRTSTRAVSAFGAGLA